MCQDLELCKLLLKGCEPVVGCLRRLFGAYQALKYLKELVNGWKTGYLCMLSLPDGSL